MQQPTIPSGLGVTRANSLYLRLDATNSPLTGIIGYSTDLTFTDDKDIVSKKYVDDAVEVENLWDRTGTVLSPHTAGDDVTTTGNITAGNLNISNWDTAYGWGDHSAAGYALLDGSNQPFTGNLGITKVAPQVTLTDTTSDHLAYIKKVDDELTCVHTVRTDGGNTTDTKVLLNLDSDYTDSSEGSGTNNFTNNGASISATSKFGGGSLDMTGGNVWIDIADNADFDFGAGEWSIDFWVQRDSIGAFQRVFGNLSSVGNNTGANIYAYFQADNTFKIRIVHSTGTQAELTTTGTLVDTTAFHHIAICRDGNIMRVFIDGVADATTLDMTGWTMDNPTNNWAIGRNGEYPANYFDGYIDEFRLNKGNCPNDYRGTGGFTPPTVAYSGYVFSESEVWKSSYNCHQFGTDDFPTCINGSEWRLAIGGTDYVNMKTDGIMDVYKGVKVTDNDTGNPCYSTLGAGGDVLANASFVEFYVNSDNYIDRLSSGNLRREWRGDVITANAYMTALIYQSYSTGSDMYFRITNNSRNFIFRDANDVEIARLDATGYLTLQSGISAKGYTENIVTKAVDYTLTATDDTVLVNGTYTMTLPAAATGKVYTIKNIGTGIVTVDGNASETIDGELTVLLEIQYEAVKIISDGTNWHIT